MTKESDAAEWRLDSIGTPQGSKGCSGIGQEMLMSIPSRIISLTGQMASADTPAALCLFDNTPRHH